MSTDTFRAARDFLLQHRTDRDAAVRGFRWPQLDAFNWALDHFDRIAQDNPATALWIVDEGGGDLVIGNFNKTLQGAGLDRQFRGKIRGLQIHASRMGARGALPLEKIRHRQQDK